MSNKSSLTHRQQRQILKRLFKSARPFWWQFGIAIMAAVVLSVVNLLLPRMIQFYIDHYLHQGSVVVQSIILFTGLYFGMTVIKAILQFIQDYCFAIGSERTLEHLRDQLAQHVYSLGMKFFDQTPVGEIISRITNDTKTLYNFWNLILNLIVAVADLVSAFVAMMMVSPLLAGVTLALLVVIVILVACYQKLSVPIYQKVRAKLSQLNTSLNENLSGIEVIQQAGQQKRIAKQFDHQNTQYFNYRNRLINLDSLLLYPIASLMFILSETATLAYFGWNSQHAMVAAGVVYAFIAYQQIFLTPLLM